MEHRGKERMTARQRDTSGPASQLRKIPTQEQGDRELTVPNKPNYVDYGYCAQKSLTLLNFPLEGTRDSVVFNGD